MFSNLYYAFSLLQNTNSFNYEEKNNIYQSVKDDPKKLLELIKVLEQEKVWFDYIKKTYFSWIEKITKKYNETIFPEEKNFKKINKDLKNLKREEQNEKKLEEKEIDKLFL